ncbi:hypothetical protein VSS37_03230 [Candidatus Thiothrix sp. Deng01]|uniref:PhoU domain-containing protein n=1 Tax=Candidatus Thiothrix phosphatis TaxID=3112415 RepID=A0ABU6CTZ1_9GAMM|nr:hypothetical protein [Candidatus Thiothrix sp. Deng01]MEB4589982.1 hypothetical protein [Candidatus Thiothrix sp. Deng01]
MIFTDEQIKKMSGEIEAMSTEAMKICKRVKITEDHLRADSIERLVTAAKNSSEPHNPHQKEDSVFTGLCTRNQATVRAAENARRLYDEMTDGVTRHNAIKHVIELEAMARVINR